MTLAGIAKVFGVVLIVIGILGFVPPFAPHGHLFGLFHINTAHNLVHILSGVAALVCVAMGGNGPRRYFQIFGIIYGLVAILGILTGEGEIFGIIANNFHDVWLHIVISLVSLYLGFVYGKSRPAAGPVS